MGEFEFKIFDWEIMTSPITTEIERHLDRELAEMGIHKDSYSHYLYEIKVTVYYDIERGRDGSQKG